MTLVKGFSNNRLVAMIAIIGSGLLLLAFNGHPGLPTGSPLRYISLDTIPQTEIVRLKRADIYVVITDPDSAKIRLQNRDSIVMSRANFDALPATIKKEISAKSDGKFTSEEIESTYPGGPSGWMAYLNSTFRYPRDAIKHNIEGTVVVQFIVDERGRVSDIEAISGPDAGGLREETIRVMQKSGKWNPAIWNGYTVKSYKRQPLTFRLKP